MVRRLRRPVNRIDGSRHDLAANKGIGLPPLVSQGVMLDKTEHGCKSPDHAMVASLTVLVMRTSIEPRPCCG
jgi:hypothetical protein